jgi:hypothetical protein
MDTPNPALHPDIRPEDRRRSQRFPLVVPISLKWIGLDDLPAVTEGRAIEGSDHGGVLEIPDSPSFGKEAALTNLLSRQTVMVQVLSPRTAKEGAVRGIPVQFLAPNKAFWGALGIEGHLNAEFQAGVPDSPASPGASRWKSLLHSLLGRPRM